MLTSPGRIGLIVVRETPMRRFLLALPLLSGCDVTLSQTESLYLIVEATICCAVPALVALIAGVGVVIGIIGAGEQHPRR